MSTNEKLGVPSQEDRDSAAQNQAEMIKQGAHIVEGGRLEATENQVEAARMEMLIGQTDIKIREAVNALGPDLDSVIEYLKRKDVNFFLKVPRDNQERVETRFLLSVLKDSKEKMV